MKKMFLLLSVFTLSSLYGSEAAQQDAAQQEKAAEALAIFKQQATSWADQSRHLKADEKRAVLADYLSYIDGTSSSGTTEDFFAARKETYGDSNKAEQYLKVLQWNGALRLALLTSEQLKAVGLEEAETAASSQ